LNINDLGRPGRRKSLTDNELQLLYIIAWLLRESAVGYSMNKNTSDTIESLERQLIATQAEVDSLRESVAQLFQLIGSLEVKVAK